MLETASRAPSTGFFNPIGAACAVTTSSSSGGKPPSKRKIRERIQRSPEDAVETTDSIAAARRVFIAFGGPPRAMGHSLTVAALLASLVRLPVG